MGNGDTSASESKPLGETLGDVDRSTAEPALSEVGLAAIRDRSWRFADLLRRPRIRREALPFEDDPLEGCDDTAKSVSFGRPGATPGPMGSRRAMSKLSRRIYGHTPPFMQVQSEAAPAPEGADETATDPEWDACVKP